jgi:5S rRNA maturation endonuclease (ribonuclease M5)
MDLHKIKNKLNEKAEDIFSKLGMKYETLGDNIYCSCPVHDGSDNPRAFSFSKQKGIWKCWTRDCQQEYRNDIFGVIRGYLSREAGKDVGFKEALKWSCNFLGVNSKIKSASVPNDENDFSKLVNTIKSDINLCKEFQEISIDYSSIVPSKYFLHRGFAESTLKYFDIVDCNDRSSKLFDRSIIPIHNDDGNKTIACIARSIKEYKTPKFLITPKGFDKRFFFYNYHRAIEHINRTSSVILVEGQSDVWRLYEAGIYQVMSLFGRTLSKEQEYKLYKLSITHVVVLLDNDQAGRESKVQIQRQLNRMYKLSFPKIITKDVGEMSVDQVRQIIVPQIKGLVK